MFIEFIKRYFTTYADSLTDESQGHLQKSALRVLLILTMAVFAVSEIRSVFFPTERSFLGVNTAYLFLLGGLLYFSRQYTRLVSIVFIVTLIITSLVLLTFSGEHDAQKYALVSLYILPLIIRLLFNVKAALIAMVFNVYPFLLTASDNFDATQTGLSSAFYFQLLTFITLSISLPLAVSRIIQTLENNASNMKRLNKTLNATAIMCEDFFEKSGTSTLLCDQRGKIVKANQLARELLSESRNQTFSDTSISDWLTPVTVHQKNHRITFFWQSNIAQCTLKQNPQVYIEVRRASVTRHDVYVLHLQNTSQLHAMQQELETTQQTNSRLAHFDLLTLLPNHRHFCRQVNIGINEQDKHLTGAMFIVRICQFKLLNKQYGRDRANRIILSFSKTLQKKLSKEAVIGRLRGVKFACFIPLGQTYLIQKNLSALIHSILPSQITMDGRRLNMDYQVGIAYYHTDGGTAEELLEHCEMALEYSTSNGRCSYYNHDLENKLVEEHRLGLKLCDAIKKKEIRIWLQPQVTPNGQIRSFEALARWQTDGKYVSPIVFIRIAEELGLLPLLAENLIKELVVTLTQWHKEHIRTPIAFNLAGQELMNDAFFALLMSLAADNSWLSSMLELEITETSSVMTHPLIHKRLRSLSQYGYKIAIDDFGTGQASLGQLVDIPANILKIDRRFVSPLPQDQRHIDIVKSTIQLAESLNMQVIAEGIETQEQANLLVALGCHTLQGYYFGKPSPLLDWTEQNNAKAKELRMVY